MFWDLSVALRTRPEAVQVYRRAGIEDKEMGLGREGPVQEISSERAWGLGGGGGEGPSTGAAGERWLCLM